MSYTLRGRLESRLAAVLLPLLAACVLSAALHEWWPLQLAGLMIAVGVVLDAEVYHRLLAYQPGWAALPLGFLELVLVMMLARALDVSAPLEPALAFFGLSWLVAQVLGHALLPLLRLSYGDDGGELGRAGAALGCAVVIALAGAGGVAWAQQPPLVYLEAGVHRGPLVLDRAQTLVAEPGAVVRGGVVIRADDVTVRNLATHGGEYGFEVDEADDVTLDGVSVTGATLDGIHVRHGSATIRNCSVTEPGSRWAQGIDVSFSGDRAPSRVERCTVSGGREGIVIDSANATVEHNRVNRTTLRAIAMNEMSMGHVSHNHVRGALGVGIFCGDHSMCTIAKNRVSDTRADKASGDDTRMGYGIEVHYGSEAELDQNHVVRSPGGVGSFLNSEIRRE